MRRRRHLCPCRKGRTTWACRRKHDCLLWSIQRNEHCYYGDQKKARSTVAAAEIAETADFSAISSLSRQKTPRPDVAAAAAAAAPAAAGDTW